MSFAPLELDVFPRLDVNHWTTEDTISAFSTRGFELRVGTLSICGGIHDDSLLVFQSPGSKIAFLLSEV